MYLFYFTVYLLHFCIVFILGNISEWSKCRYTTKTPKRRAMKVPKAFQDCSAFNKFKSKCSDRVFESEPPPSIAVVKKEDPER